MPILQDTVSCILLHLMQTFQNYLRFRVTATHDALDFCIKYIIHFFESILLFTYHFTLFITMQVQ